MNATAQEAVLHGPLVPAPFLFTADRNVLRKPLDPFPEDLEVIPDSRPSSPDPESEFDVVIPDLQVLDSELPEEQGKADRELLEEQVKVDRELLGDQGEADREIAEEQEQKRKQEESDRQFALALQKQFNLGIIESRGRGSYGAYNLRSWTEIKNEKKCSS